jgi:hypothetical protein
VGKCGLDSSGSGQGPVAGSCEDGNELSGSMKWGEYFFFFFLLSDYEGVSKSFRTGRLERELQII